MADTFALESELAETIVAQLKAKLSPEEKAAIEEESTSDPLAHDLFLEANALITAPLFNVQGTQNLFEARSPREGGGAGSELLPSLLQTRERA